VLGYTEDGETKAQYYGTTDANPDKAIHKPAWHTPDNKIMLAWNQNGIKRYNPKPWFVTLRPDMIIGNLSFNAKGSLTEQSITLIKSKGLSLESLNKQPKKGQGPTASRKRKRSKKPKAKNKPVEQFNNVKPEAAKRQKGASYRTRSKDRR
jgi:hypothetical protein